MRCAHRTFPDLPFVAFTVSKKHEGTVIFLADLAGQRHAHTEGKSLPQASGGRLDAVIQCQARMHAQDTVLFTVVFQEFYRVVARQRHRRIEGRDTVALAQDETVPVFPVRILGIDVHDIQIQGGNDLDDGISRAEMHAAFDLQGHLHGQLPDLFALLPDIFCSLLY